MKLDKKMFQELRLEEQKAAKDLSKIRQSIEALQDICSHEYKYEGHGHKDALYTCSICNRQKWE